jgi:hypothetical protein
MSRQRKRVLSLVFLIAALLALAAAILTIVQTYQSGEIAFVRLLMLSILAGILFSASRAVHKS